MRGEKKRKEKKKGVFPTHLKKERGGKGADRPSSENNIAREEERREG